MGQLDDIDLSRNGDSVHVTIKHGGSWKISNCNGFLRVDCIGASLVPYVPHLVDRPDLVKEQKKWIKRDRGQK